MTLFTAALFEGQQGSSRTSHMLSAFGSRDSPSTPFLQPPGVTGRVQLPQALQVPQHHQDMLLLQQELTRSCKPGVYSACSCSRPGCCHFQLHLCSSAWGKQRTAGGCAQPAGNRLAVPTEHRLHRPCLLWADPRTECSVLSSNLMDSFLIYFDFSSIHSGLSHANRLGGEP